MRLSMEAYLLVNFLMDTLLLALALRAVGLPVTRRVITGGAAGAIYAGCCVWLPSSGLNELPLQGIAMLVMLLIAAGPRKCRPRLAAAMALQTLLIGGALAYAAPRGKALWVVFGAIAVICMLILWTQDERHMALGDLSVRIRIRHGGQMAEFTALIDTGNRLQEPFSGLPVLIAEERQLKSVLLSDCVLRQIPYGGLGGSGFLEAFRPESLEINRGQGWQAAPPVWVAIYPGRLSGKIHALAPPAFALQRVKSIREERM